VSDKVVFYRLYCFLRMLMIFQGNLAVTVVEWWGCACEQCGSQTVCRDPEVGRDNLPSGSRTDVVNNDFWFDLFSNRANSMLLTTGMDWLLILFYFSKLLITRRLLILVQVLADSPTLSQEVTRVGLLFHPLVQTLV
jgi:hypothetical protein